MTVKIKKCKGFEVERCETCKRKNSKSKPLVTSLAENGTCIHYVQDLSLIKNRNKF